MGERRYGLNPKADGFEKLDWSEFFGNDHPLVLEIGSGKGRFLLESARERPQVNFIGIERSLHYYRFILDRLQRHKLPNIVAINFDGLQVIQEMFAGESLDEIHIYFPDPWPRPRERKRRLMQAETMRAIERVMKPQALGVFVTDHREYFDKAVPVVRGTFEIEAGEVRGDEPPRTNYEAKYREEGRPMYQISFRRGAQSAPEPPPEPLELPPR